MPSSAFLFNNIAEMYQFMPYYCYRGEPVVRLAGEAPFRYAGHAQVVNGEQAAAQLIIFR
ncbi:hypothetical protein I8R53_33340, partial [Pseudomonas aeruginosa]|nr:hypothetical protein [Pseudomonas aeruginosa]